MVQSILHSHPRGLGPPHYAILSTLRSIFQTHRRSSGLSALGRSGRARGRPVRVQLGRAAGACPAPPPFRQLHADTTWVRFMQATALFFVGPSLSGVNFHQVRWLQPHYSRTAAALHVIAVLVLIFDMNGALITMTTFSSNSSGRLPALHTRWSGLTVCSCPAAPAHGSVERAAFRAKALVSLPAVHNLRPDLPPDGKVVRNYSHPTSRTVRDTLELMATLRL